MQQRELYLLSLAQEYLAEAKSHQIRTSFVRQNLVELSIACLKSILEVEDQLTSSDKGPVYILLSQVLVEETNYVQAAEDIIQKGLLIASTAKLYDFEYRLQILWIRLMVRVGNYRRSHSALSKAISKINELIETELSIQIASGTGNETNGSGGLIVSLIHILYGLIFLSAELFPDEPFTIIYLESLQKGQFLHIKNINAYNNVHTQHLHILQQNIQSINMNVPPEIKALSYIIKAYILLQREMATDKANHVLQEFEKDPTCGPQILSDEISQLSVMFHTALLICKMCEGNKNQNVELGKLKDRFRSITTSNSVFDKSEIQLSNGGTFEISWGNIGFVNISSDISNVISNGLRDLLCSIACWLIGENQEAIDGIGRLFAELSNPSSSYSSSSEDLLFIVTWLQSLMLISFSESSDDLEKARGLIGLMYSREDSKSTGSSAAGDERNNHIIYIHALYLHTIGYYRGAIVEYCDIIKSVNDAFLNLPESARQKEILKLPNSEIAALAIINLSAMVHPDSLLLNQFYDFMNTYSKVTCNQMITRAWAIVQFETTRHEENTVLFRRNLAQLLIDNTVLTRNVNTKLSLVDIVSYYILSTNLPDDGTKNNDRFRFVQHLAATAYRQAPNLWKLLLGPVLHQLYASANRSEMAVDQDRLNQETARIMYPTLYLRASNQRDEPTDNLE